ncbi:MAG: hypothetical protein J7M14_06665, partial [Planctomycetes bacterium]|nr:hypothetical protein [Planctomycetota bacterium]
MISDSIRFFHPGEWIVVLACMMQLAGVSLAQGDAARSIEVRNSAGLRWVFDRQEDGYSLGTIYLHGERVELPLSSGILALRNKATGEQRWLKANQAERVDSGTVRFSGKALVEGVLFSFLSTVSLEAGLPAAHLGMEWSVDRDLPGWEVCFAYHEKFSHSWTGHIYPVAMDAKFIERSPLTYVGIPAVLTYRDDLSLAVLFGIDPGFDYLNPTTWTGDTGLFFMDQLAPPQFRVGGGEFRSGATYSMPLQLVFNDSGDYVNTITHLIRTWVRMNHFTVTPIHVRTADEALSLFLAGRRKTSMWNPGIGYRLEEGDPESNFVYIGEQPLSAYFEYLIYEMTGDKEWRRRCFEQMDFVLRAQQLDRSRYDYGAIHTAYDLGKHAFDSNDRGRNVGFKPDLNAHIARYMLLTWERVRNHEGINRQDWYQAAVRAADWVLRQRNPDGGLPQVVEIETGRKSMSHAAGRALPALPVLYRITGDPRYLRFARSLERYTREYTEGHLRFTGHHPDLPPDELEEASIWGLVEYWLNKYERTGEKQYLERAVADAYLAFLWWCPKDLSWVKNPTLGASAEQEHFLQYSIYCYQNRKIECLHRLSQLTGIPLFGALFDRITQS